MARETAECPHDERGVGELLDANDLTRADAEDVDELRHETPARRPGSTAVAAEPDDDGARVKYPVHLDVPPVEIAHQGGKHTLEDCHVTDPRPAVRESPHEAPFDCGVTESAVRGAVARPEGRVKMPDERHGARVASSSTPAGPGGAGLGRARRQVRSARRTSRRVLW